MNLSVNLFTEQSTQQHILKLVVVKSEKEFVDMKKKDFYFESFIENHAEKVSF